MYTRCPACQTVFHLRAAQIRAAQGQVRCGDCGEIFQSLSSLYDDPDTAMADTSAVVTRPQPEPETGKHEERADPPDPVEETTGPSLADALAEPDTDLKDVATKDEVDVVIADSTSLDQQDEAAAVDESAEVQTEVSEADSVEAVTAVDEITEDRSPARFDIPPEFILDNQQAGRWSAARAASWAAALVLILTLVGQGIYVSRGKLADDPALLPWVARFCSVLDCNLPFPRDVGGIQVVERQVREHPETPGALLVYTTFVNTSSFVQPWPVLELRLADLSGGLVAGRRFLPAEYLNEKANVKAGMPPSEPVSIELELVQPDINVVSYQFDFL